MKQPSSTIPSRLWQCKTSVQKERCMQT